LSRAWLGKVIVLNTKWRRKGRFSRTGPPSRWPLRSPPVKKRLFFSVSYACPEPVLVH
jgi:hypothetical protein